MAKKKKVKTPEDIINDIRIKQSEIEDLLYDLEEQLSDSSDSEDDYGFESDFDEEEVIDETDEE